MERKVDLYKDGRLYATDLTLLTVRKAVGVEITEDSCFGEKFTRDGVEYTIRPPSGICMDSGKFITKYGLVAYEELQALNRRYGKRKLPV